MAESLSYDCSPYEFADHEPLLASKAIRKEHERLEADPYYGHVRFRGLQCVECTHLAYLALCELALEARSKGWNRDRAIREQFGASGRVDASGESVSNADGYVATSLNNAVKDAQRRERPADGRLARPREAARGAHYRRALTNAREAGRLCVDIHSAVELHGFVIQAAQDPTAPVEAGQIVSWGAIEIRLAEEDLGDVPALGAHRVWLQVEQAFRAHRPAANLLDKHVYTHSQKLICGTAGPRVSDEDTQPDPVAEATDEQSILATPGSSQFDDAVAATARGLARRGSTDARVASALGRRAFLDVFGDDPEVPEVDALIELIAKHGLEEAAEHRNRLREEQAKARAAIALEGNPHPSIDDALDAVTDELAAQEVTHPYDLSTEEGRSTHQRWMLGIADDVLRLAQHRRLGKP